jgi:uncharacterized membrane protein
MNQFAAPGLGSIMAGRYLAGACQLLLALAGFGLVLAWFFLVLKAAYSIMESVEQPAPPHYLGWLGLASFLLAWIWAWVTSIRVLRRARQAREKPGEPTPPPPPGTVP